MIAAAVQSSTKVAVFCRKVLILIGKVV